MLKELVDIGQITFLIKMFVTTCCIYYVINNTIIKKTSKIHQLIFYIFNILISSIHTLLRTNFNAMLLLFIIYLLYTVIISGIFKIKLGQTVVAMVVSYALCNVFLLIGTIISFVPYKMIFAENEFYGTLSSSVIQFVFTVMFLKIKRIRSGLAKMFEKFDKAEVDMMVVYISIAIILVLCFIGSVFDKQEDIMKNMMAAFIILGITMYIMIQRTITMQYKHSLLLKTLEEYKEEIESKDKEIEKLSAEKFNTSKIRHEFYNRQKALELIVKQNMSGNMDKLDASENILKIVNELTSEYSKECEIIKGLVELPKTDVLEIDNIFKYMQTECAKNNIDFKLNIQDSIEPLLNTYISKSRLETLLGDHIRDAINAVNKSSISNKEIMVVLGLKDGNYEICILDNGVEFGIDTLLKLGKEQVTTGGTGIGFLTTFETLRETKASLVITEYNYNEFTKSVAFVFNNKCEYIVNSYRADLIVEKSNREDIIINKIEG